MFFFGAVREITQYLESEMYSVTANYIPEGR